MKQRLDAARERGRRWAESQLKSTEPCALAWGMPASMPRWRAPTFAAMLVDDMLVDDVYRKLIDAAYHTARETFNAGRKKIQAEQKAARTPKAP